MNKRTQDTIRLQKALKREGFDLGTSGPNKDGVDGSAGPLTTKALLSYQEKVANQPKGIDVSFWQSEVNWGKVARSGVVFAYCKATDGLSSDPKFSANWKGIKEAGLLRGAYCWFHPSQDLEQQAQKLFKAVGILQAGDLPVWIDVERDDKGPDQELGTKDDIKPTDGQVEAFANRVAELTGKRPIVYSYSYYLDDRDLEISNTGLAIADYRSGPPTLPPGWPKHTFHQYLGDEGTQEGVSGACDKVRFNGSMGELRSLAGF